MITAEDILNMNFYKKEKFTGSYKGMRYLVKKEKDDAENDIFRATVWPGPYNFSTTPDDQKISATFPFTEEGIRIGKVTRFSQVNFCIQIHRLHLL